MTHLLDVSTLLAAIWKEHPANATACAWLAGKTVAVCPLSALDFVRISSQPGGPIGAEMAGTRAALSGFIAERGVKFLPDDVEPLESRPETSKQVTDAYLATLAQRHGLKLATLDGRIKHPAAETISAAQ